MERREQLRGFALVILGSIFWGISSGCGQYLFQVKEVTAKWLISIRLPIAGLILLLMVYIKERGEVWRIWKEKKGLIKLFLFAIVGMGGAQFGHYTAIEKSNAGTATVLQYTAPVLIMLYVSLREKKMPKLLELIALVLSVSGTFLLATHGDLTSLAISTQAFAWGMVAACGMAAYNLIPISIMKEYGTFCVLGWGMFISGALLALFVKPWHVVGDWDVRSVAAAATVILVGTVVAFAVYLEGVQLIGAPRASLCAAVEPVAATLVAVIFMGVAFVWIDLVGFVCILSAVILLSIRGK